MRRGTRRKVGGPLRLLKTFSFLIGLGLFVLVLWNLDLRQSWAVLTRVDLRWFLFALPFAVPEILFKSLRLRSFVTKAGAHISVKDSVLCYLSGQPLGVLTPGKLGDVSRIVTLNHHARLSMPKALAVHAADRIYDLAAVLLLALIGFVSFISEGQGQNSALGTLIGVFAGMTMVLALLNPRWIKWALRPLSMGILSRQMADKIQTHGKEFHDLLQALLAPSWKGLGPLFLSFLAWETAILRAYVCALALGLPLGFLKFVLLAPVMIMVELLPISILGIGPREQAMFALYTTPQLTHEALLAFDLLIVTAGPLFISLVGFPAATQIMRGFWKSHEKK